MQKKNDERDETFVFYIFRLSFHEMRGNIYPCSLYIK
jgi:hypothetical protein